MITVGDSLFQETQSGIGSQQRSVGWAEQGETQHPYPKFLSFVAGGAPPVRLLLRNSSHN